MGIPVPSIEEDKKAIDKFKLTNYACFSDDNNVQNNIVVIKNKIKPIDEPPKIEQQVTITDKKTLALLKLRRR